MDGQQNSPLNLPPQPRPRQGNSWLWFFGGALALLCVCTVIGMMWSGRLLSSLGGGPGGGVVDIPDNNATLTVAVSPSMAPTFETLVERFNAQNLQTPDGRAMRVETAIVEPETMVAESLGAPTFQALTPDSSLWLNQLEQRWAEQLGASDAVESLIPIGSRRIHAPTRYAVTPIVIVAWESVARELGWPLEPVGWQQVQRMATRNPDFRWNHPSTNNASGLLATLAEFYAGAGLTRGLTAEAATAQETLDYVRDVEATIRFYGEGETVIMQRLAEEGRRFLDAFVAQEQVVIGWNQAAPSERLVAIYPAEGTLWADHPLALLELESITANQRRTYQALVDYLTGAEAQQYLLAQGYRPADLDIVLDAPGSPFADTDAVDWRQPQTTLQIPSPAVVEVVQNVWWYTKRPTNVFLVVDTSGSMQGNKLTLTQEALRAFLAQIQGDRDQVGLIEFGSGIKNATPLRPLDEEGRQELTAIIDAMDASGNTALLDAVWEAYRYLAERDDQEAINAIVVMTDGRENYSRYNLREVERLIQDAGAEHIVIFTIGFGNDIDEGMLRRLAELGGGQFYRADEADIEALYRLISTYF